MIWFRFSKPRRKVPILFAASLAAVQLSASPATDQEQLVAANTAFAFNLANQLVRTHPDANLLISPFSVSTALQMLSNGAEDETKRELQQALKTSALAQTNLNRACAALNHDFTARPDATLDLADGLWYQKGFHLQSEFEAVNRKFFQAELAEVDFNQPDAAKDINRWADGKTEGKVKEVVRFPFPPLTRLVLADAIYFKSEWVKPFQPKLTHPRAFHLPDGRTKPVPMMERQDYFIYQETREFQAVELPYEGHFQMELFLPATNSNPQRLLAALAAPGRWLKDVQSGFGHRDGAVILPKFKFAAAMQLKDALQAMGICRAFAADANFLDLAQERVFVSQVQQSSFISVDEAGTEAAAGASVQVTALAELASPISFVLLFDRPFVVVITDVPSNSILFLGVVSDPTAAR